MVVPAFPRAANAGQHERFTSCAKLLDPGRELDTADEGFLASFDGPARATRCARAMPEQVQLLGLEIRAGLHTGECELVHSKVAGSQCTSARASLLGQPPVEVLVSRTSRISSPARICNPRTAASTSQEASPGDGTSTRSRAQAMSPRLVGANRSTIG